MWLPLLPSWCRETHVLHIGRNEEENKKDSSIEIEKYASTILIDNYT
jgi:hypothetical protein